MNMKNASLDAKTVAVLKGLDRASVENLRYAYRKIGESIGFTEKESDRWHIGNMADWNAMVRKFLLVDKGTPVDWVRAAVKAREEFLIVNAFEYSG
jgi:hypothetical protein